VAAAVCFPLLLRVATSSARVLAREPNVAFCHGHRRGIGERKVRTVMNIATEHPVPNSVSEPEPPLRLTEKAVKMIKITREQEGIDPVFGLRVAVRGGGCSGFEYALDFDNEQRDSDFVLEYEGLRVYVDAVSSRYLAGTTIDYNLGMSGAGFKFQNPRAVGTCGCGSSFAV
jgi:iron-sulfur cluster insertion protein